MPKIFVYGTLKKSIPVQYHVSHLLDELEAEVDTIQADLYLIPGVGFSFPAISNLGSSNTIKGEVFEITNEMLQSMDTIEGADKPYGLYKRSELVTNSGTKAFVYEWNKNKESLRTPIKHGVFELLEIHGNGRSYVGIPLGTYEGIDNFDCYIQDFATIVNIKTNPNPISEEDYTNLLINIDKIKNLLSQMPLCNCFSMEQIESTKNIVEAIQDNKEHKITKTDLEHLNSALEHKKECPGCLNKDD